MSTRQAPVSNNVAYSHTLELLLSSMSLHTGRGEGLEACHHREADLAGHTGPTQRPQRQGSSPGRGLHQLLSEQVRLD